MKIFTTIKRNKLIIVLAILFQISSSAFSGEIQDIIRDISDLFWLPIDSIYQTPLNAPDFSLTGINDEKIQLSELPHRLIILNGCGTWCPNCNAESPGKTTLWEALKDYPSPGANGFYFIAAYNDDTKEEVINYMQVENNFNFPAFLDDTVIKKYMQIIGATGFPSHYFIINNQIYSAGDGFKKEWGTDAVINNLKKLIDLVGTTNSDNLSNAQSGTLCELPFKLNTISPQGINFSSSSNFFCTFSLFNVQGEKVQNNFNYHVTKGNNLLSWNNNKNTANGMFILKMNDKGKNSKTYLINKH